MMKGLKVFTNTLPESLFVVIVVVIVLVIVLAVFDPAAISRLVGAGSSRIGTMIASMVATITLISVFAASPAAAEFLLSGAGVNRLRRSSPRS